MSKLLALMSMSLDGFVADVDRGVAEVFDWYFNSGDVEIHTGGASPMTFTMSETSAQHVRSLTSELGAVLTGRRTFDAAEGWGGNHGWGPAFVLLEGSSTIAAPVLESVVGSSGAIGHDFWTSSHAQGFTSGGSRRGRGMINL